MPPEQELILHPGEKDVYLLEELFGDHFTSRDLTAGTCPICMAESASRTECVKLTRLPEAFMIVLARFGFDRATGTGTKNQTNILLPRYLDFSQYCDPHLRDSKYELTGSLRHQGEAISTGHYTCDNIEPSGIWQNANDSTITRVPFHPHVNQVESGGEDTPYMLMYVKSRGPSEAQVAENELVEAARRGVRDRVRSWEPVQHELSAEDLEMVPFVEEALEPEFTRLTQAELTSLAKRFNLPTRGRKQDLIAGIEAWDRPSYDDAKVWYVDALKAMCKAMGLKTVKPWNTKAGMLKLLIHADLRLRRLQDVEMPDRGDEEEDEDASPIVAEDPPLSLPGTPFRPTPFQSPPSRAGRSESSSDNGMMPPYMHNRRVMRVRRRDVEVGEVEIEENFEMGEEIPEESMEESVEESAEDANVENFEKEETPDSEGISRKRRHSEVDDDEDDVAMKAPQRKKMKFDR